MNKHVRQIRKSISKRQKSRELPKKNTHIPNGKVSLPLPEAEEKHGYLPTFLESDPPKTKYDSRVFFHFLIKGILSGLLFLSAAFIWDAESRVKSTVGDWTSQALTEEFPFAKMNHWYRETFGTPLSFRDHTEQVTQEENMLALPVSGNITEDFEANGAGIYIEPEETVSVSAMQEGIVVFAGKDNDTHNTVIIQHPDGSNTTYGHLQTVDVHLYQFIKANQIIGDFTPTENERMVYFSIEKDREYVDPFQVIKVDDNQ